MQTSGSGYDVGHSGPLPSVSGNPSGRVSLSRQGDELASGRHRSQGALAVVGEAEDSPSRAVISSLAKAQYLRLLRAHRRRRLALHFCDAGLQLALHRRVVGPAAGKVG